MITFYKLNCIYANHLHQFFFSSVLEWTSKTAPVMKVLHPDLCFTVMFWVILLKGRKKKDRIFPVNFRKLDARRKQQFFVIYTPYDKIIKI